MTVTTTVVSSGPYAPNGSTKTFPFSFKALSSANVLVVRQNSDGVQTTLTGYTVTLNAGAGGSVVFGTAPATGDPLYILLNPDFQQQASLINQGAFVPSAIEGALDAAALRDLVLLDSLGRALRVSRGETLNLLPGHVSRGNHYLTFDSSGNPAIGLSITEITSLQNSVATLLAAVATGNGSISVNGTAWVANRSALAAISSGVAFLSEPGREGIFVWSSANLSAFVTADTTQGVYVAPASAPSGASGAWVRKYSGPLNICWFGAVANCTAVGVGTDCASAINAAIAVGALVSKSVHLLVPKATLGYRVGSTIVFTYGVRLQGEGFHENPGLVAGVSYTAPAGLPGSVLVFDANVPGLRFVDFTDNAANAVAYEFEGSRFSVIEDLRIYGGSGTNTDAHGVETRTQVNFRNVSISKFAGNGLYIIAATAGSNPYGNASSSLFSHLFCLSNGCHGVQIVGIDSNIMTFMACQFRDNGGAGVLDQSYVGGNVYIGCQFATNNASFGAGTAQTTKVQADTAVLSASASNGSIICDNTANTPHVFTGIYVEGGNGHIAHLPAGCLVPGGILSNAGSCTAASAPMVLDPSQGGKLTCDTLLTHNGYLTVTASDMLLDSGHALKVAGQQVVAGRQTGMAAPATDAATVITLANSLRTIIAAHGLAS